MPVEVDLREVRLNFTETAVNIPDPHDGGSASCVHRGFCLSLFIFIDWLLRARILLVLLGKICTDQETQFENNITVYNCLRLTHG